MELNVAHTAVAEAALPVNPGDAPVWLHPAPVAAAERIHTIDVIRGFALLGILMMNIPGFGMDGSIYYSIVTGPHRNPDFYTFSAMYTLFEGTMRGLFSMLFGAGMVLFTLNKTEKPGGVTVAEYYYRRLLWLVLFGLFNAYVLLWFGDILYFYGLCGMLLFPFRKAAPKWLLIIGFICIAINMCQPAIWYGEMRDKRFAYKEAFSAEKAHRKLTADQQQAKTAWVEIEKHQKPDKEVSDKNISKMHSGYGTIFGYLIPRNEESEISGMYLGMWDMLGMMFIGMGLFALGFFNNRLSTSTYVMTLLLGYGVGLLVSLVYVQGVSQWMTTNRGIYIDTYRTPHFLLYDIRRVLLSVGHASLLMLVYRSRLVPWLMSALASVGQMAFTNYLMQSIICTLFFYGYGLNQYNNLRFYQLYYVVAAVWIFQLICSPIWMRYFHFGPFEWLWRSLTYWRLQPMRKRLVTETV